VTVKPFSWSICELFVRTFWALSARDTDITDLVERAGRKGLPAVVAGPLMGKTFLLTHVAWLLSEDGYLVGFMELAELVLKISSSFPRKNLFLVRTAEQKHLFQFHFAIRNFDRKDW
jgi:hypothetical protein